MAISYLRYLKQPHGNINSCTIYVDEKLDKFMLTDPWISPLQEISSNITGLKQGNSKKINFLEMYPSP